MESNTKQSQQKPGQVIYAEPQIFLSQDSEYVIHLLPGNVRVRKHINYYKKILGIDFVPKAKSAAA